MSKIQMELCVESYPGRDSHNENDWVVLDNPSTDEIEVAWMALEYLEQNKGSDVWQRSATKRVLRSDGSVVLHFEIPSARILPSQNENLDAKRYVLYALSVRRESTTIDPNPTIIERRYTDFYDLYNNLKKDHPNAMNSVSFPDKVLIGNFSPDLIGQRSVAFEVFLDQIVTKHVLRDSPHFLRFLQDVELEKACRFIDERQNESAIPLLENSFNLLNKIFTDRSKPVMMALCRLVAACTTSPVQHPLTDRWAKLALWRFETICDTDLLPMYIPLLHTCVYLWWQHEWAQKFLLNRLRDMFRKGINVSNSPTLVQAIHAADPRSETI